MGAVALDAGWIGPDGVGGAYKNKAEVLQAQSWYALGGDQGVLKGMSLAGVGGSMAIDVAAGACLVSRRDGAQAVQNMGYLLPVPVTTRVAFDPASASARNDCLVAAVVDTTDGAVGTAALAVGGQLAVVKGVSGTSTPRTDAQIAAWLGRGGFVRLADVPIASTDTQINMANVVASADSVPVQDSGTISNAFTVATGWTISGQSFRKVGKQAFFSLVAVRTGAAIVSSSGNIANTAVATWDTAMYPIVMDMAVGGGTSGYVAQGLVQAGTLYVTAIANVASGTLGTGDTINLSGTWPTG